MSVINRVLKDLDRKGAAPLSLGGVQVVHTTPPSPRAPWLWLLLGLGIALTLAWWLFWPRTGVPAGVATTAPAVAAPVTADTALAEGPPRLRLSATLSEPAATLPAPRPSVPPPTLAEPTRAAPAAARPTAALAASEIPFPVKLDTRLPQPRPPRVLKEDRPPTPQEQAEQAWRQAARLIEQGRGRDAQEGLETALRLDPNHGPARQSLIALSLEGGDGARGEILLREGLQLHPQDAWYARSLGQVYLQRGDSAQAAAVLKAGLGKGVDAAYWGLYAGVLSKIGRNEEAIAAYREAARQNPAHGPWWLGLAVTLEQADQRQEAAAAYQRALQTRLSAELREFAAKKAAELH